MFYGSDDHGIFSMTTGGISTFVGQPAEGDPKALAFAELDGETKLLMGEKSGGNLWQLDPETAEALDDPVELFFTRRPETIGHARFDG